ncbi:MAG: alpha-amylase family protein, partial [Verrucomicrobiota bacterium]
MVEGIIRKVKPDYIQCDSKGHPGFSSYPTKVGTPAPGFVKDPLRIWRDVTAEHGVALYVHHSGVWDTEALRQHPSWSCVRETGKRHPDSTSLFSPYVDKVLIPQIKELSDEYDVDGIWIDGECWAACQDYGAKVLRKFREETGIEEVPRKPDDPCFFEFTEFIREAFRHYLNHYVTEVHKHNPDFQICSNWAYSSYMPEPVEIDVDFLSGDYPLTNSVNMARLESRCLVYQGKPWDLMAWGFTSRWEECSRTLKSAVQMMQEAAVTISQGGGIQFYFQQRLDGSISEWQMEPMAEVAKFCRERQDFCHGAVPVPQIAMVYPGKAYYRKCARIFSPWSSSGDRLLDPMRGVLQNLLDSQNIVDITMEHQITGRMNDYPLIVLPEWGYLDKKFKDELLAYVEEGGNLLLVGPEAAALFKRQLGVRFVGKSETMEHWLMHDGYMCNLKTPTQKVVIKDSARSFGELFEENNDQCASIPAASIAKCGKGRIAAIYTNLGERYDKARNSVSRDFLNSLVCELFPTPLVEVSGSHLVDVAATRKDGKLMINLINTSGPHGDDNVYVFDEIQPVGPLEISI